MTHREFIACMEDSEAGRSIFDKYKELYAKHNDPVAANAEQRFFVDNESSEYITLVEKLLQHYRECIQKLGQFVNLQNDECDKVIRFLEEEVAAANNSN